MASHDDEQVTDPDEYLRSNPTFAKCRKGHAFPHEDDVPLLEAYSDPEATHEKTFVCSRCKAKKRERFLIGLRRGRVVSYVRLDNRSDYKNAEGYLAKGVRISRAYATEVSIRAELEDPASSASTVRAHRRKKATPPAVPKQRQAGRKAAVA
ncbi:hypothetical protein [Amycolatopsis sp. lyj-84]|uniref:hypothetical protein n=1 Tax=Amycolatopsis sp. lyj-84 TaxID=2789284 RepID=UPI00397BF8A5